MLINNWKNNTEKIVHVILMPIEHNLNGGFAAEYINSTMLRDPEQNNIKCRHHIVRRLDNNQIMSLNTVWYRLKFRNDSKISLLKT